MPNGKRKGSSFEREICRQLSLWWTDEKRDDIFWRSASSGGRATQRMKQGKFTAGACGDICAVDPKGNRLMKMFTIELKCGRSHGNPGDLIDSRGLITKDKWIQTMIQAMTSARDARSQSWLIISHRDMRQSCVFFDGKLLAKGQPLRPFRKELIYPPAFLYKVFIPQWGKVTFVGVGLERFLASINPHALGRSDR